MLSTMVPAPLVRRRSNLASSPIARALLLSLLFHACLFLTIELGHQAGWWKSTLLFQKSPARTDLNVVRRSEDVRRREQPTEEMPLMFVTVDPSQAVPDAPTDAKYYSALNSRAANPDPKLDTPVPKIDGKQERVPQTMERARPELQALQPAPTPPPQVAEQQPEPAPEPEPKPAPPQAPPRPTPTPRPGDLAYLKPAELPKPPLESKTPRASEHPNTPSPPRPRTLAMARQQKGGIAGDRVKQQGGVRRFSVEPSFDVRSTPFGAYDAAIIAAIQKHWYDLIENREFSGSYSGKVVLEFRLNSDGSVTDMRVGETDVTEILALLCQRAVQDPAPFARWPADLRRLVGKEYRDVRFTFYYN
jgi:protein TonB